MIDPLLTFVHSLFWMIPRLPAPFVSLLGVFAVFAVILILLRIVRGL